MKLLIVESPAKAKTIGKYIGSDYEVVASVGHIRDLPKSNKKAIDIDGGFIPHYEISKGKERVVTEIKQLAKKADEILLATDPDREGEAIAWHLAEEIKKLKIKDLRIKRVSYHEITKEAIEEALKHPRDIDQNLRKAQEARRVLDRLVGYDLSGLIWKKVRYGLSAGRVQSPALRILMEREREIRAFKPETFFVISAKLSKSDFDSFIAFCEEQPKTKKEADKIYDAAKNGKWKVFDVVETETKRSPRAPFTTSTLQQTASTRLGFSPKRTMMTAQKLYEVGHITYMRTDSATMAESALLQIKQIVSKKYGANLHQTRVFKTKSKNAQEAHEAIRPTHFEKENIGHSEDQKRLYKLIWERSVSSQMKDAKVMRTKIVSKVIAMSKSDFDIATIPNFSANGSRVLEDGWLLCDSRAKGEDVILPKLKQNDDLNLLNIEKLEKQTEPPNRYSEAGLIKELEKRGIGRPSTYASTINTIIEREYVEKDGKTLKPTDTGDIVSTFLENNFEEYISDTFTAEMEDELDDIALGKRKYEPTLREFYKPFLKEIKDKEKTAKLTTLGNADPKLKCPLCHSGMVIKLGRGGKFLSCDKFPECSGMRNIDGSEIKEAEALGTDPETKLPVFVMDGRFGPYIQLGAVENKKSKSTSKKGEGKVKREKPKRASISKNIDPNSITLEQALKLLSLPRELGSYPETGEMISANVGRFGPYIVHQKDFRSLKEDNVYAITLERAIEILKEPKKVGRRGWKKKPK
ncbi:MAG: DNA topoisomerase I [Candidatus Zambryskibacteria bacterium CG10_big_fil_rev_8_21_14_0_10_34_34]|uniref:DNA topoisomerase 1 n=1 Tax=Candidatus Zambryskibacteria bacterium CG10_big_fil_rev_8_21_14_0_10_34_34 TaxID=1975114 RepID=A0A2H0R0T2_9BACT|nr:MAG: DNA topoisomerase I [Candidatus Zambryskibacteria bacterium CG10_big_fil_rev_8_21_14_0_10_34_34]